jgi:hypothetical protein
MALPYRPQHVGGRSGAVGQGPEPRNTAFPGGSGPYAQGTHGTRGSHGQITCRL